MIFRTKLLPTLLALSIFTANAHELTHKSIWNRAIDYIGQSTPITLFNQYIFPFFPNPARGMLSLSAEPASIEYQEMGKEAQAALGIAVEKQLPVFKLSLTNPITKFIGAIAEADAIYINEEKCNQRSYGTVRCLMFHESVHIKYRDKAVDQVVELATLIGSMVATHKVIQAIRPEGRYKFLHGFTVFIAGVTSMTLATIKYHHYMERRADIEGHYATQCHMCVAESAANRRIIFEIENNPFKHNGYLYADDLEKIAADLKAEHKVCAYHCEHSNDNCGA